MERCLAHLGSVERSPNTVRAHAHGLGLWFEFLGARRLVWDSVRVEDISRFVAWPRARADNVIVFDDTAAVRSAAAVNRHLGALFGFYDLRAPSGLRPPRGEITRLNADNHQLREHLAQHLGHQRHNPIPAPSATCLPHETQAQNHQNAQPYR